MMGVAAGPVDGLHMPAVRGVAGGVSSVRAMLVSSSIEIRLLS